MEANQVDCDSMYVAYENGKAILLCGGDAVGEGMCNHCCMNCKHAIDMDCTMVCPTVAEFYYPSEEES